MRTVVVIPSRYGSTRFPGKPLAPVAGRSLLERVWRVARAVQGVERVLVATDDARIARHVAAFGGEAVLTPESCRNGTERAEAAIATLDFTPDAVVNLQGDAVLTPPWVVQAVVDALAAEADAPNARVADIVTPATILPEAAVEKLAAAKAAGEVGGTTVTVGLDGFALYFSKAIIPFRRDRAQAPVRKHIGLYGFRREALARVVALPPTPLELAEGLEQLRALEHGLRIRVVEVDLRGRSTIAIDDPADVARVEAAIAAEGELVP
ncbi:MAG: 3-deoxy-manno-octulosonate cytidylyltransferase [Planctomycetota bacterium]